MKTLVIESKKGDRKGRSFSAHLVAHVRAWDQPDWARPQWMLLAGSEGEMRPFLANLLMGRRAKIEGGTRSWQGVEILKSAGYEASVQREEEGVLATVYLPDLARVDPGMVDKGMVRFLMVAPRAWVVSQRIGSQEAARSHVERVCGWKPAEHDFALAMLFAAYLDRRTRAPIVSDPRFCLQLYHACLREGLAAIPLDTSRYYGEVPFGCRRDVTGDGFEEAGVARAVAFRGAHEAVEQLLAVEVERYFEAVGGKKRQRRVA